MLGFRDTGRADLFEALYKLSHPEVLGWVSSMRRGIARRLDPDDLAQEVFLSIHRYRGSFKERQGGYRAWCMTIARNLIRRQSQSLQRKSHLSQVDGCDFPDLANGPTETAISREEAALMRRAWQLYLLTYAKAFEGLSPRDQEALHLVEIDGLRYAEAAERLGVGLSNMKMILLRARQRIRRKMGLERQIPHKAAG